MVSGSDQSAEMGSAKGVLVDEVRAVPQRVSIILAGGVLLLGLAGASLFRRPAGSGAPPGTEGGDRAASSGQVPAGPQKSMPPRGRTVVPVSPTAIPSYYAREPVGPNAPLPRSPHLPSVIDRLYEPRELAPPPESEPAPLVAPSRRSVAAGPWRNHKIADGDALPGLAARYLGDAAKWPEIWEANRRVLSDPEVLPLGLELRIPPR